MTNKQIIIDGCNVSECYELFNGCCCDNGSFYCKEQPNCKFKLEKRGYKIEQITEFTPREELIETITHLRVLNAELESYNEQLKEGQNIEIKENKILREQLEAKEQECEALASQLDFEVQKKECLEQEYEELKNTVMQKCPQCGEVYLNPIGCELYEQLNQLKADNEELTTINARLLARLEVSETDTSLVFNLDKELRQKEKEFYTAIQKVVKLKQTLIEIKEIIEQGVKIHDHIIVSKQILQKISEFYMEIEF